MYKSLQKAAENIQVPSQGQNGARQAAQNLESYGRYGDTHLIHISTAELEQLKKSGKITKNPHTGLPEAFNLGHAFQGVGSGLSNLFGSMTGKQADQRSQQADFLANTMNDPHRAQSQAQYGKDLADPSGYFQNNPYARNALSAANNLISAQSAKSGNPTNVEANVLPQVMASIGQNYNQLLGTEQVGAGLNQGAGYAGVAGNAPFAVGQQQKGDLVSGLLNGGSGAATQFLGAI